VQELQQLGQRSPLPLFEQQPAMAAAELSGHSLASALDNLPPAVVQPVQPVQNGGNGRQQAAASLLNAWHERFGLDSRTGTTDVITACAMESFRKPIMALCPELLADKLTGHRRGRILVDMLDSINRLAAAGGSAYMLWQVSHQGRRFILSVRDQH